MSVIKAPVQVGPALQQPVNRTHDGMNFRVPCDLAATPSSIRNVLLIGQCLLNAWKTELEHRVPSLSVEHILFNFTSQLPTQPQLGIEKYDFQIIALPLRPIVPETKFLGLSYSDTEATAALFEEACQKIALFLRTAMRWNSDFSLLTFVTTFLVPQQNPMGRLMPRHDLRNMACFVERLNERLSQEIINYKNAYLLDIDSIAASVGRRYIQDDAVSSVSHGSVLANFAVDKDAQRIEPPPLPITRLYNSKVGTFIEEVWREATGMFRTLRQIDVVKMVIVDLDDTIWRGVLAEQDSVSAEAIEGWPLGTIEALAFLKKRGMILAIVSKNDECNVKNIFDKLLRHHFPLESFALKRINWLPKSQNIAEIIAEANLTPKNVVFIDDNPVERASVAASFPDMRIIGSDPYAVRRILLWSPETQVPMVTSESARRSEMIRAQVIRETTRQTLSRDDFLKTLDVRMSFCCITSPDDLSYPRALELLNKTNQFNTTGKRWSFEEVNLAFRNDMKMICFSVEDNFTDYGLVGVVLLHEHRILQYIMSCRVLGLDVEKAALAYVARSMHENGVTKIEAALVETAANLPCRNLYGDNHFVQDGDIWTFQTGVSELSIPQHVRIQ